jgi:hypothetical protein
MATVELAPTCRRAPGSAGAPVGGCAGSSAVAESRGRAVRLAAAAGRRGLATRAKKVGCFGASAGVGGDERSDQPKTLVLLFVRARHLYSVAGRRGLVQC